MGERSLQRQGFSSGEVGLPWGVQRGQCPVRRPILPQSPDHSALHMDFTQLGFPPAHLSGMYMNCSPQVRGEAVASELGFVPSDGQVRGKGLRTPNQYLINYSSFKVVMFLKSHHDTGQVSGASKYQTALQDYS